MAVTTAGRVLGHTVDGIHVFKGVRYGADTATTRFASPRPPLAWSDTRDASTYGNQAPQGPSLEIGLLRSWTTRIPSSEDCLFLNIWTPALRDERQRPIMVWLHGGGFATGSGASPGYDGARLARRGDVVVITINHRLNFLAHLNLSEFGPEFSDSANAGLLDIVLALQWVRDNAAEFGGDARRVTLFGQSGGGAKISTLMAMDAAKGLFHRAIVQSGFWLTSNDGPGAARSAAAVVRELGLTRATVAQIRTTPFETLRAAAIAAMRSDGDTFLPPVPSVDGHSLRRHPFAPDAPPQSAAVPLLIGLNRTETTMLLGIRDPELFDLTWATLPAKLTRFIPGADPATVVTAYRDLQPRYSASDVFFAATTDNDFLRGHVVETERKAAQASSPAFFYMLDWNTPIDGGRWRCPHALDIAFVFDNVAGAESMCGQGPEQDALADIMSDTWIAFAHNGRPDNRRIPPWPAYSAEQRAALLFSPSPRLVVDPHGDERRLFDHLPIRTL